MYPFNFKRGQRIQTNAGIAVDRGFIAHLELTAAQAVAASNTGVGIKPLAAEAQTNVTAGLVSPAVPRALRIVSNKANGAGNVKIYGTNIAGEAIDETLALNGTTPREGAKAFRTVTKVDLPAQVNTPVKQVETATAAGTASADGDAEVTVTSALFAEPVVVEVAIAEGDDAAAIAGKIRAALAEDPDITAHFDVSGATTAIILTAKVAAANDGTLNIAIATGTATGVEAAATSANTTAGVAPDAVSIGWNDVLGLPYLLAHNTVLAAALNNVREANAPTVTVSATALESNTCKLHSSLAGQAVDIYLIV